MSYAGLGQTTADLIPDPWTQRKAAEFKVAIASANAAEHASATAMEHASEHAAVLHPAPGTSGLGQPMPTVTDMLVQAGFCPPGQRRRYPGEPGYALCVPSSTPTPLPRATTTGRVGSKSLVMRGPATHASVAPRHAMPRWLSGLGGTPTRTKPVGLSRTLLSGPSHDYIARRVAALSLGASMVEQVHPDGTVFTGRREAMQPLRSFRHFDTGSKQVAPPGHWRPNKLVLGQTDQSAASPPAVKPMDIGLLIGWGALVVTAVGLFWATTSGVGMGRTVRANPRRRKMRRNVREHRTVATFKGRRSYQEAGEWLWEQGFKPEPGTSRWTKEDLHQIGRIVDHGNGHAVTVEAKTSEGVRPRYFKPNLSDASRRRLPKKAFVFPGRRAWPIDTRERAFYAIQALRMGRVSSASDFNKIRNAIRHRYPSIWREYGRRLSWEAVKRAKLKGIAHRRHRRRRAA